MEVTQQHIRYALVYEYHRNTTASQAAENICAAYGADAIASRTAQKWFQRFRAGDFSLEDQPRSGRPSIVDDERLQDLVREDPRRSLRELARLLDCGKTTVEEHLDRLGMVYRYGRWLPHALTEGQKTRRHDICLANLTRNRNVSFLHRIITADEKWVLHANMRRRKQKILPGQQPLPDIKPELHQKKVMLCVFWDRRGVIFWELLDPDQTLNGEVFRAQLEKLRDALERTRPDLVEPILLIDNARPHTAKETKATMANLGFEVLSHPAYSPDIAPSDYHLFRSLQHFLEGRTFNDVDEIREALDEFFTSKPVEFYEKGIDSLPERWQKVVDCDGAYFD